MSFLSELIKKQNNNNQYSYLKSEFQKFRDKLKNYVKENRYGDILSNFYQYYMVNGELKDIIGLHTNVQVRNTENVCMILSS